MSNVTDRPCRDCGGTGTEIGSVPYGVGMDEQPCATCGGSGRTPLTTHDPSGPVHTPPEDEEEFPW